MRRLHFGHCRTRFSSSRSPGVCTADRSTLERSSSTRSNTTSIGINSPWHCVQYRAAVFARLALTSGWEHIGQLRFWSEGTAETSTPSSCWPGKKTVWQKLHWLPSVSGRSVNGAPHAGQLLIAAVHTPNRIWPSKGLRVRIPCNTLCLQLSQLLSALASWFPPLRFSTKRQAPAPPPRLRQAPYPRLRPRQCWLRPGRVIRQQHIACIYPYLPPSSFRCADRAPLQALRAAKHSLQQTDPVPAQARQNQV